jgi:hypothetical protein
MSAQGIDRARETAKKPATRISETLFEMVIETRSLDAA